MICLTVLQDSSSAGAANRALMIDMKVFVPYTEDLGGRLMDELGLNLGDLVPFRLDYECLRLGEDFCDAEIHGPRAAWEGVDD